MADSVKLVDWDEEEELGKAYRNQFDPEAKAKAIEEHKQRSCRKFITIPATLNPSLLTDKVTQGIVEEHHQRHYIPSKQRLLIKEDISNGINTTPVSVYSDDIDDSSAPQPLDFRYIKQNIPPRNVPSLPLTKKERGDTYCCSCKDGCNTSECECLQLGRTPGFQCVLDGDKVPLGRCPLNDVFYNYLLVGCGSKCACQAEKCSNRLRLDKGRKLEIFKRGSKRRQIGFGVRTLNAIVPGQIVVEFSGEVVSYKELCGRPQTSEDYSLILYDRDERTPPLSDLMSALHKRRVFLPNDDYYIDPYHLGNLARFCGHGCTYNLDLVRYAENDLNPHAHRILLVANAAVLAGSELFIDYGEKYKSVTNCLCRTTECTRSGYGQLLRKLKGEDLPNEMRRLNRLLFEYSKELENDKLYGLIIGPYLEEEKAKANAAANATANEAAVDLDENKEESEELSSKGRRRSRRSGVLSDGSNLANVISVDGSPSSTASKRRKKTSAVAPAVVEVSSEDWTTDSSADAGSPVLTTKKQRRVSKKASKGTSIPSSPSCRATKARRSSSTQNPASRPPQRVSPRFRNSEQAGEALDRSLSSSSDSNCWLNGMEADGILHQIEQEIEKLSQMGPRFSSVYRELRTAYKTTDCLRRNLQHFMIDPRHGNHAMWWMGRGGTARKEKKQIENRVDRENVESTEDNKENVRPDVVVRPSSAGSAS